MDRPSPPGRPPPLAPKSAARAQREAEALRANLRKRKDQARAREQGKPEPPKRG